MTPTCSPLAPMTRTSGVVISSLRLTRLPWTIFRSFLLELDQSQPAPIARLGLTDSKNRLERRPTDAPRAAGQIRRRRQASAIVSPIEKRHKGGESLNTLIFRGFAPELSKLSIPPCQSKGGDSAPPWGLVGATGIEPATPTMSRRGRNNGKAVVLKQNRSFGRRVEKVRKRAFWYERQPRLSLPMQSLERRLRIGCHDLQQRPCRTRWPRPTLLPVL